MEFLLVKKLEIEKTRTTFIMVFLIENTKGQLISKAIYGLLTSSKKMNGQICFVCFFTLHGKQIKSNPFVFLEEVSRP